MGTTWSSAVAIGVALLCASGEASASAPPHELASDRPLTGLIASGDTLFYGVNSGYFFATEGAAPRKLASTSVEWGSAMSLGNGRMLANNAFTGALLSSDGTASGTSVITTAVRGEVLAPDPVFGTPPPEYRAFTVMDGVALFAAHLPDAPPGAYSAWRSDGTAAGTYPLHPECGAMGDAVQWLGTIGGKALSLAYACDRDTASRGALTLYASDGATYTPWMTIAQGSDPWQPYASFRIGETIVFGAAGPDRKVHLWQVDDALVPMPLPFTLPNRDVGWFLRARDAWIACDGTTLSRVDADGTTTALHSCSGTSGEEYNSVCVDGRCIIPMLAGTFSTDGTPDGSGVLPLTSRVVMFLGYAGSLPVWLGDTRIGSDFWFAPLTMDGTVAGSRVLGESYPVWRIVPIPAAPVRPTLVVMGDLGLWTTDGVSSGLRVQGRIEFAARIGDRIFFTTSSLTGCGGFESLYSWDLDTTGPTVAIPTPHLDCPEGGPDPDGANGDAGSAGSNAGSSADSDAGSSAVGDAGLGPSSDAAGSGNAPESPDHRGGCDAGSRGSPPLAAAALAALVVCARRRRGTRSAR